jgi:hypothetical protein
MLVIEPKITYIFNLIKKIKENLKTNGAIVPLVYTWPVSLGITQYIEYNTMKL